MARTKKKTVSKAADRAGFTLRLPADLAEEMREHCEEVRMVVNSFVELAIREKLERETVSGGEIYYQTVAPPAVLGEVSESLPAAIDRDGTSVSYMLLDALDRATNDLQVSQRQKLANRISNDLIMGL